MSEHPWAWSKPIRERWFGAPLLDRYRLKPVSEREYWDDVAAWRDHWPPEVYFDLAALRDHQLRERHDRLEAAAGADPLTEYWTVRDGERMVALFSGRQQPGARFEMTHAQVHPDERGRGIYSAIVRLMIEYTAELGFETIVSEHGVGNNAVLIPKLRAGFHITGLEVSAAWGTSIRMTYFHDPEQLALYRFRYGDATLTPRLIGAGFVGMERLREQFRSCE